MSESPATDTGAIGLEGEAAQEFAGDGAVGGAGRGGEQAGGQRDDLRRPVWVMIAARSARLPEIGPSLRTGAKVIGAKLINSGAPETEFQSESGSGKPARAQLGEEMADQVSSEAARQLRFFIARVIAGGWILRILADAGQG